MMAVIRDVGEGHGEDDGLRARPTLARTWPFALSFPPLACKWQTLATTTPPAEASSHTSSRIDSANQTCLPGQLLSCISDISPGTE
ncbi:hypothetical protein DPEC_G00202750 [Dallia pectoralis]|uniref:Uncharacterized protein n=1 Tax=Dallia pectoralis TaxID=75939 RepID=A0ACC2G9G1_DALPE|nr:hypothetical protein DPEC_G00202750 [Dallia pectoralis]